MNSGFELYSQLPCKPSDFDGFVDDWHNANSSSSDYFNLLSPSNCFYQSNRNIIQSPRNGNGVGGLIYYNYGSSNTNYREYMQSKLTTPLIVGNSYYAEMFVQLINHSHSLASNNFGFHFSLNSFNYTANGQTLKFKNHFSQVNDTSLIVNDTNWVRVCGTFVADSAYEYITIGNFHFDYETKVVKVSNLPLSNRFSFAWYLIDDVKVVPTCSLNITSDTAACVKDSITLRAQSLSPVTWMNYNSKKILSLDSIVKVSSSKKETYYVSNGCNCKSVTVDAIGSEVIDVLGNDTSICIGDTIELDALNNGATYLWNNGSNLSKIEVFQPGVYWVDIHVNNCIIRDSISISIKSSQILDLGVDTTLCDNDSLNLVAGTSDYSYIWQDNSTDTNLLVKSAGVYWVSVDYKNCVATDSIKIDFNPLPIVDLGIDTLMCSNDTLHLDITTINATYLWNDGSNQPINQITKEGRVYVSVEVSNCVAFDSLNVSYLSGINIGNDTSLCEGDEFTIDTSTDDATYLWNDNTTQSTLNVRNSGVYDVKVNIKHCIYTDTIIVTFEPKPPVNLGNDTVLCENEILYFDLTRMNVSYLWQDNSTSSTYEVKSNGTYWVLIELNGCTNSDTINVNYNLQPRVDLGEDFKLCSGDEYFTDVSISGEATYIWHDGSINSYFKMSKPGFYWVSVTENNCSVIDSINIQERDCEVLLDVPNIFTPNNDGINDLLIPKMIKNVSSMNIEIYNRWGRIIYETTDKMIEWDGGISENGTYYWNASYLDIFGNTHKKSGNINLLR